ncbi:dihydrodipicolinate synthase family protein [Mycetocola tolaasinivorans]|uniref:Dihydrodipicolinate synthase family protein n=1 Tax=Mycetocola tolaasinivorans TaxID=76635 RepID=A0A3L7A582_9MICO|nr:dihydrodipicolinate synthase family protein [Mycetocola tolaasinivorans]RLP74472.1 dihydrodipicolinate synthase family protein [Mycetocola tolaasinivorans]
MTATPFTGLIAYPITPLDAAQNPDLLALERIIAPLHGHGIDAVTVLATSGAGVSFEAHEHAAIVAQAVTAADGQLPVYAAITAHSTPAVIARAQAAESAGAAGVILAPFSYLPLGDAEVRELIGRVSDATDLPIAFYNKPVQLGYDITPDTLDYLVTHAHVRAIKEPSIRPGQHDRAILETRLAELRSAGGPGFSLGLSGDLGLLAEPPAVDAWHTGLAAFLPAEYHSVWAQDAYADTSRRALRRLAEALASGHSPIGGLHVAARTQGSTTADPLGPVLPATAEETAEIVAALS